MVFYKDMDLSCNKINSIILSGGAYYGLLYNGLIKFLEDNNIYNDIKTVYGVSIGALFALIINLRINYNDLEHYMSSIFNPNEFINIHGRDILNILEDYGINDGSILENSIKKLLELSGYNPCITFKELYEKTNINLNIGIVKVIANTFFILNYKTSPDYPVWLGIRASLSVPVLFTPIKDYYFNDILVDGGVLNNLPIRDYLLNYYYSKSENKDILNKDILNKDNLIENEILDKDNNLHEDEDKLTDSNILDKENILDKKNILKKEKKN
jgi:predicted acylesterase/phospholipase RssA